MALAFLIATCLWIGWFVYALRLAGDVSRLCDALTESRREVWRLKNKHRIEPYDISPLEVRLGEDFTCESALKREARAREILNDARTKARVGASLDDLLSKIK